MSQNLEMREIKPVSMFAEKFFIPAMDCPVEEEMIRKRLVKMPGIRYLKFDLVGRRLNVEYSSPATAQGIEDALVEIGMIPGKETGERESHGETSWRRLIAACVLALFSELAELGDAVFPAAPHIWDGIALAFAIAAIIAAGAGTFKKGCLALARGDLNINALMAVAVTGAVLIGQFPEAAMVMALFEVSEALEGRAMLKARAAIKNLLDLAPRQVEILRDGTWSRENADAVMPGDLIRARPGERIGADGVVVSGHSAVNQAPITGESMPVEKGPGDQVYAGSINEDGSLEFKASAKASDTTLARIIRAVEQAQATKAPVQRFVDKFARYYTPAVFFLAILAGLGSLAILGRGWHESIYTALVILVIGCPCALVISTPVSIVSALSRAAAQGILIKGGAFLEEGRYIDWLALDKTGTITRGRPEVVDVVAPVAGAIDLAVSMANRSDHPVSRAIARYGAAHGARPSDVKDFKALPGQGVAGSINGQAYELVKPAKLAAKLDNGWRKKIEDFENAGNTVAILAGDVPLALFAVADGIKPGSVEAIAELKKLGVKTVLLSGDNPRATASVAAGAGVDEFRGELLPDDKMSVVDELRGKGHKVGMVGDGINDAPALASADIGFAMASGGTDTAIETADVALMDDDLRKLPRFIRLSRDTRAIVAENIIFALGVKAAVFALALAGLATMWMAVLADVGTTLCVVANGMRLLRK